MEYLGSDGGGEADEVDAGRGAGSVAVIAQEGGGLGSGEGGGGGGGGKGGGRGIWAWRSRNLGNLRTFERGTWGNLGNFSGTLMAYLQCTLLCVADF